MKAFTDQHYWAVILGGSSGIGLATARKLASQGMNLCLVHRDRKRKEDELTQAFDALKQEGVAVLHFNRDALKPEIRDSIVEELAAALGEQGKVRLVLHAIAKGNLKPMSSEIDVPTDPDELALRSGVAHPAQLEAAVFQARQLLKTAGGATLGADDFALTVQAMATSHYDWVKALNDANLFAADARVLALTSEGNNRVWRNYAAVSAAKAALEAIARSMALEFAPHGIRSNIVQAGITDTPSLRMIPGNEQLRLSAVLRNPFHRLTTPADVANVISLLASDDASWINGAVIPVDGGEKNS